MHLISSMVILKPCLFFSFDSVLSWLQSMVEEGWLKMLCKRKFRELKPDEEEKALLKNPFQNHRLATSLDVTSAPVVNGCHV